MSTGTKAVLLIDDLPELGEGARRYAVDCRWSTSTAHYIPGGLDLPPELLILQVASKHEAECGQCDMSRVWKQVDPRMLAEMQRLEQRAAAYGIRQKGRRN